MTRVARGKREKERRTSRHPWSPPPSPEPDSAVAGRAPAGRGSEGRGRPAAETLPWPGAAPALAREFYGTVSRFQPGRVLQAKPRWGGWRRCRCAVPRLRGQGCHGWSRGQCPWGAAQHSPGPGAGPFCPTARPARPRVFLLTPARCHSSLPVPVHPARATLSARPACPCPARTPGLATLSPRGCSWLAGNSWTFAGGCSLSPSASLSSATKEEGSCFLWEMGEERRVSGMSPVSSPLSQSWKQLARHLPSPTWMADRFGSWDHATKYFTAAV